MRSLTQQSGQTASLAGESAQARHDAGKNSLTNNRNSTKKTDRSGAWSLLVLALFMGGLHYGGYLARVRESLLASLEFYFQQSGIVLKKIVIKGQQDLSDKKIIAALGITPGQSLFGFDASKAQKTIASIGQVRSARVMRLLPSTLLVEIVERKPFARWLQGGQIQLVDRTGSVLRPVHKNRDQQYPLIAGQGARGKAAQLIRLLSVHEELARHIKMAELVSNMHWHLHARSGALVKLPAGQLALALARLVRLPRWDALLANGNVSLDLRLGGRIFVNQRRPLLPASRV